jgi:predicted RNA binding protein YcfA (HicA-like mRNA interferase family)
MTAREIVRRMRKQAESAVLLRQVGSHQQWLVNSHCRVTVPVHTGDVTPGVVSSIRRQAAHCLGRNWL